MTHTTRALYMQDAKMWAKLPYEDALKLRIIFAKQAMAQYRIERNEEGYMASEKAKRFNEKLLGELISK